MTRWRWSAPLLGLAAAALMVSMGFAGVARIEENDAFCASCHAQPELVYFERTQAAAAVDLASAHAMLAQTSGHSAAPTRCIDCHSEPGLVGRAKAMSLGARDAIKWVTGTAIQPAVQTTPIGDGNCLKCHADVLSDDRFDMHSHPHLPRWQHMDESAATCVTCHTSHTTDGNAALGFLHHQRTLVQCDRCHVALGVE